MRMLLFLLMLATGIASAAADNPQPAAGIILLKAVAGYDAQAVEFKSIMWIDNNGGFVVDGAGNKVRFINDAIGRIVYFDETFYDEVNHNQNWVNWRAGLQSREIVLLPVDTISLTAMDLPRLRSEQAILENLVQRYSFSQPVLGPLVDRIKDDVTKLSGGQTLQNGQWIAANQAAPVESTPVVGMVNKPVSFTTKAGRKFVNAKVMLTDNAVSVLTSDGGASLPLDQLPDDLSGFPKNVQDAVHAQKEQARQVEVQAKNSVVAKVTETTTTFWQRVWAYIASFWAKAPTPPPAAPESNAPSTNPPSAMSPPPPAFDPNAVVLIKGDKAEGTGFLTKTAEGPVVITNLHVIAANPHARIFTTKGEEIVPLVFKGASDRDIAMFSIQDNHYSYLKLAKNVSSDAAGDPAVIPGNSEGGEVTLKTDGKIVGVGPQRVEFSNPIFHGNSGGPVLDLKTGEVVGVVVGATVMKPTDALDQNSFANANSAIKGPVRYFGLRLDTVPEWQTYDQDLFVSETLFLQQFHEDSRALDSFLNGAGYEKQTWARDEGAPDSKYYLTNEKVRNAEEAFATGSGHDDRRTAVQELVWALGTVANQNFDNVEHFRTFYPYDQDRAKYEFEYRKALKGEIEKIQSSINTPTRNSNGIGL